MKRQTAMVGVLTLVLASPAAAQIRYRVTNMNEVWLAAMAMPEQVASIAGQAMNNQGQIVGVYETKQGGQHGFIWDARRGMTDLGNLGQNTTFPYSINCSGQVVGESADDAVSSGYHHAFLWDDTNCMRDLGSFGMSSYAVDINDRGQVVGASWYDEGTGHEFCHAFLWTEKEGMRPIGVEGEVFSAATSINDVGEIVGIMETPGESMSGVLWDSDGVAHNIGAEGPLSPVDINDNGVIVAEGLGGSYTTLVTWTKEGGRRDLGALAHGNTSARSINNIGQIVGSAWINPVDAGNQPSGFRAFLWEEENGLLDLNDLMPASSLWVLTSARSIDDEGWILAEGLRHGEATTLLLTPVPEPNVVVMLLAILLACGITALRDRN